MINHIIRFSIHQRFFVLIFAVFVVGAGIWSAMQLPIDAVPDVSNNQVQINTVVPGLAPEEVEQQITFPMEIALSGMPHLTETRSLSQSGLSQVNVVFDDSTDIYFDRQLVTERLQAVQQQLPATASPPSMAPVSTALGEIYYVIVEGPQNLMERRSLLDWVVKPQLRTVPGIIEVNTSGGQEKQYQVLVDPQALMAHDVTLRQVQDALTSNNQNAGGAFIRRGDEQELVRGVGLMHNLDDIRNVVVGAKNGIPILIKDVAQVQIGPAIREGATTTNGKGETVVGITMLLMGENSRVVVERVKDKVKEIQKSMPAGTKLVGFLDRSELVNRTLDTALHNLVEGGVLVIVILFLFLLQLRAGLIVSSAIPLAMLFAIIGMRYYGVSANLMSLGAIDFGLIVDGAVIIVENCVRRLSEQQHELGRVPTEAERLETIEAATVEVRQASQFGELIIVAAYVPILSLVGVEGKMFRPMGATVILALVGALLLSLTLIPAFCAFFLRVREERKNVVLVHITDLYRPALEWAMRHRFVTVGGALVFMVICAAIFPHLGSEFLPKLEEGALLVRANYPPSIALETAIARSTVLEQTLKEKFPDEIDRVITRIGRSEVATDPQLVSESDAFVSLKPPAAWKQASSREDLIKKMDEVLSDLPGVNTEISQPIEDRMEEVVQGTGIHADLGIKVFGDDMTLLGQKATEISHVINSVRGAADLTVETTEGQPVLNININRAAIARYGINIADVQNVIEAAVGGMRAGDIVQGNALYDVEVRLAASYRNDPQAIGRIVVPSPGGARIPLSELADIKSEEGPVQISRDNGERRVVIQANVRGRDLGSFVDEVQKKVDAQVKLPVGYHLEYGGTFQNLQSGRARLMIVVPITFGVIFLLLFTTFSSLKQAALVFTGIPLAITGGILALLFRGMHFSMSAGIGFIALFGVAVLNGVVLVTFINHLRQQGESVHNAVVDGCLLRLRPVLMTAAVASIGFIPMALATGAGAEVQKPLATVVIGGLLTSTVLTLFVLPTLYVWFERD
ncbi:MAG: efflux RND transporter permease subunit [Abitibacteriaceae bacterium]|nr:efflux RND transporter permease subunit [Abditibacteriaceae bacterium]